MSFPSDAEKVIQDLNEYYEECLSGKGPVISQFPIERIILDLDLASPVSYGGLTGEKLLEFVRRYLSFC